MDEKKELLNAQIGKRIQNARKKANLTQDQLSEKIDISCKNFSLIECGKRGISIQTLIRLCDALNISSDSLLFPNPYEEEYNSLILKFKTLPEREANLLIQMLDVYIQAMKRKRGF